MDELIQSKEEAEQSGNYIVAWIISVVSSNIVGLALLYALIRFFYASVGSEFLFEVLTTPIQAFVAATIWIFVYSRFSDLKISVVVPWIVGFGIFNIAMASGFLFSQDRLNWVQFLSMPIHLVIFVSIFGYHFAQNGRA